MSGAPLVRSAASGHRHVVRPPALSVPDLEDAVGQFPRFGIVGDHHDRPARCSELAQQRQDLFAGLGIQAAGRLVGQDDRRIVDDRPRDGNSALLAPRELGRKSLDAFFRSRPNCSRTLKAFSRFSGILSTASGSMHVLDGGEIRQQFQLLEDEADVFPAKVRLAFLR